ncbi:MAG: HEPN domain-containing protein [Deltaproteobacteria bacterium]|nr:HEPN domain-containing protein [Deltaproteobacteria bacterium]
MKPDPLAEGRRWLLQAEHDLDDARYAEAGARYSLACFLAQQAAEKALKGYLYARGADAVLGHSVADLCDEAGRHDVELGKLKAEAGPLDRYYIQTRYPNSLPGGIPAEVFDRDDAEKALRVADRVIGVVRQKLGKASE